jgi:hypothetical protein
LRERLGEGAVASEHWKDEPDDHDFPAAVSYLSLLVSPSRAEELAAALRNTTELTQFAPKDILRASGLALLAPGDLEVAADLDKIKSGKRLSPVLLVRGDPLWVADGYHRVCASYHTDAKVPIPARIVDR